MSGEIILYQTEDGAAQINLRAIDGTVWLTQAEMAALFDTSKQNVSLHLRNIFEDGELANDSVVKESLIPASDGKSYATLTYNLDAILAVGFRVRSKRGVQFRRWAGTVLQDYLVKGFAMDDAKLKAADQWDYFDEWLARIRDIRASEKRFYQKVKDLFTTAVDYDSGSDAAKLFFQKVQNKMLWAVTGHTAAEIIAARADPEAQNMGLTSWKGSIVRKGDVGTGKNYLTAEEVKELNRIVTMYLDFAEDQAQRRKQVTMAIWAEKLDAFLAFNDREVLTNAGKIRMDVAQKLASNNFAIFDTARKRAEAEQADSDDLEAIEALAKSITYNKEKG